MSQYKIQMEPQPGAISHLRKSYHDSSLVSTRREDWLDYWFLIQVYFVINLAKDKMKSTSELHKGSMLED